MFVVWKPLSSAVDELYEGVWRIGWHKQAFEIMSEGSPGVEEFMKVNVSHSIQTVFGRKYKHSFETVIYY